MKTPAQSITREEPAAGSPPVGGNARVWIGVCVILLLAIVWRLVGIRTTEAWRDEAVTLLHLHDSWWNLIARLPVIEDSPPLYFLILKAWSLVFTSEWTMRLPAVVFGVATVAAMMKVAQMIRPGSWWAVGLLVAVSPVPVHYSQEIRVYALLTLAVVLCFWATELIVRDPRSRRAHLLWALFAVLAAHCHAIGMFIFPMTGVYLLARLWPRWRTVFSPWSIVPWLIGCLPMFWFNLHWALVHKKTGWWIDPANANTPMDLVCAFTGVFRITGAMEKMLDTSWINVLTGSVQYGIPGVMILLILAAVVRPRTRRPAIALLAAAGSFVLIMVATSLSGVPNMIERTMLPGWMPVLLLMGLGAAPGKPKAIGDRTLAGLAVGMAALCAGGWFSTAMDPTEERRPSFSECFRWIAEKMGPEDMVIITPGWLEDSAAYYLPGVSGEQFFTTDVPAYTGRPPRPALSGQRITVHNRNPEEGSWSERLRQEIGRRQGKDCSVWFICGRWQILLHPGDPEVGQLRSFIKGGFDCVDSYVSPKFAGIVADRFVPNAFAARHRPATGAATRPE